MLCVAVFPNAFAIQILTWRAKLGDCDFIRNAVWSCIESVVDFSPLLLLLLFRCCSNSLSTLPPFVPDADADADNADDATAASADMKN
jgi:hypothetical protein